jgi:hypothetical protein
MPITVRVHLLESSILQLLVRQTLMVMLLEVIADNNYRNFGISSTGAVTTALNINSNQLGNASGGLTYTLQIQVP